MVRRWLPILALLLVTGGYVMAADHSSDITIMTQNMDDGTDLTYVVAALLGAVPGLSVGDAVDLTFAELQSSSFAQRANLLAQQIALRKPDIVVLQEATLWRTGFAPNQPTIPLFDQIELLRTALKTAGVPYDVAAVDAVNDVAVPGNLVPVLRQTDRNAMLVRSDLRPPEFHLSNVHSRIYQTTFPFGSFQISTGWIAATVHTGNKQFRLVTTHLMSPIPNVPEAIGAQLAQAQELINELRNVTIPVVIGGDFNSDATHAGYLDDTPTVNQIVAAGYNEVWPLLHGSDPGLTWPLYFEDLLPAPPFVAPTSPKERIDMFFYRGLQPISIERVLAPAPAFSGPPFGSDHAGVIAVFHNL